MPVCSLFRNVKSNCNRMFLSFLFSRHRKIYIKIAYKYKTSPSVVYRLAHGKVTNKSKHHKILADLKENGVVSKISYGVKF